MTTMDYWPYCEHPGCHDRRTNDYGLAAQTGTYLVESTNPMRMASLYGSRPNHWPGFRRWCGHHAMQHERWRVG